MSVKEEVYDKKYQHIGIKLTLVRSLIECLGGKIIIESNDDNGTVFQISIPFKIKDKPNKDNIDEKALQINWKNKKILIAEDDITNYQFLEAILSDTQAQLIHVEDGKQAVEIFKTIPNIDIILMDIKMPEKSGYEAVKEIKKIRNVPIIAQTAYSMQDDKNKCLKAGCDDYISKPIDIRTLIQKINIFIGE